eukprot:2560919-Amphidinium_carterae.1
MQYGGSECRRPSNEVDLQQWHRNDRDQASKLPSTFCQKSQGGGIGKRCNEDFVQVLFLIERNSCPDRSQQTN